MMISHLWPENISRSPQNGDWKLHRWAGPRILSQLGLQIAVNEGLPSAVKSGCRSLAQFSDVYAVMSTVSISFPLMTVY